MAATTWRLVAADTGGNDLVLSQLRLWDGSAAVDAGAVVTSSHAPVTGNLSDLSGGGAVCRFSVDDVNTPGFYIQWVLPTPVDAWCVRFTAPSPQGFLYGYDLQEFAGARWRSARNGRVPYPGDNVLSVLRIKRPEYGAAVGWTSTPGAISGATGFSGAAMTPNGATRMAAGFGSGTAQISLSTDSGATWVRPAGVTPSSLGFSGCAVTSDGQVMVVVSRGAANSPTYMSRNGGSTWSVVNAPSGSGGLISCAISGNTGDTVVTSGYGSSAAKIGVSKDGGATWASATGPSAGTSGFAGCAVSADGSVIAAAGHGNSAAVVSVSRNGGSTWQNAVGPVAGTLGFVSCAMSADGQTIVAAGYGSSAAKVSVSRDAGLSWSDAVGVAAGPVGFVSCGVSPDGATLVAAPSGGGSVGVSVSRNNGVAWSVLPVVNFGAEGFDGCCLTSDGGALFVAGRGSNAQVGVYTERDAAYTNAPMAHQSLGAVALAMGRQPDAQGSAIAYRVTAAPTTDPEFGGNGRVYGTTAIKNAPTNAPVRCRVRLHRSRDGLMVRELWSKPDGTYSFDNVNPQYEYDVIAWDNTLSYRSVVANNVTPETP